MPQGTLGNLKRDIEDLRIRKEIEDANRICVLAGDFFMATASTQLAEIENQLVVKQISKERTKPRIFLGRENFFISVLISLVQNPFQFHFGSFFRFSEMSFLKKCLKIWL